jgi:hypothetical protein
MRRPLDRYGLHAVALALMVAMFLCGVVAGQSCAPRCF